MLTKGERALPAKKIIEERAYAPRRVDTRSSESKGERACARRREGDGVDVDGDGASCAACAQRRGRRRGQQWRPASAQGPGLAARRALNEEGDSVDNDGAPEPRAGSCGPGRRQR